MTNQKVLPAGWKWVKLGDICEVLGGGTPKTAVPEYWGDEIVWLSPVDLPEVGSISLVSDSKKKITKKGLEKSSAKLLPKGSVVFSSRASIGKIGITEVELATNQGFTNFICKKTVRNDFLSYVLKSCIPEITGLSNSTTFKEVSRGNLKKFQIPLPPLDEQRRIVERLDTIFTEIDAATARLTADLARTTELRESALNEIFAEGKEKWEMKTIEEISEKIQYGYTGGKKQSGKWKYLRITDIQDRKVDWKNVPFSDISEKDSSKYLLKKGDLLFARSGATAGKTYLFEDNEESVFASYLIRVLPKLEKVSPLYLYQFFQSPDYWSQVSEKVSGAAQPNVNGKKLASIKLPLPSLDKQRQIVTHLDGLFAELDALATEQKAQLERLKELRASVLEGAMRGEG